MPRRSWNDITPRYDSWKTCRIPYRLSSCPPSSLSSHPDFLYSTPPPVSSFRPPPTAPSPSRVTD
ncbi:uncharacterized protein K489DRAFT_381552 [Dissoconium aciculare CBS 342.82]|uniref:Uncharacterized protein n=1 Tax=Dissoconium aciculare CBS 342.82 TaxID=1314786 RepID=A0A6J3M3Q4_9PEZI|nr:uncharacterized protein K489DRAFT_381552 [Dissoconium aciculare CBS 342.82]KAF1821557.1 hypothetical protein K489DRAFT_381552 [Dissoconium aciculare CBS 342.82]